MREHQDGAPGEEGCSGSRHHRAGRSQHDKKEAITEVLVRDSGVMVISGIYTIRKTDGVEGIPVFSKIPLLGWLFKREAKEDERKDLLIFISPKIIKDQI